MKTRRVLILACLEFFSLLYIIVALLELFSSTSLSTWAIYLYPHNNNIKQHYRPKSHYTPKHRHTVQQPAAPGIFRTFFSLTYEQTAGEKGSGNNGEGLHTRGFKRRHQITSQGPLSACSVAFCTSLNHPQQAGSPTVAEAWVYFGNLPIVSQSIHIPETGCNEMRLLLQRRLKWKHERKLFKAANMWLMS